MCIGKLDRAIRRATALARDKRGTAAVEMAIVSVPLLLFIFAIIEVGQAVWLQNALDASVAAAARCASIDSSSCGTASQIQSYAASQSGAGFRPSIFSVSQPSCGNQVSAQYPLALTVPFMALSLTLTAEACYPS